MDEDQGEGVVETSANPMRLALSRMNQAPRCGARTRSGSPCRQPAVRGRTHCRMHGARAGAPEGPRNGAWRHGGRSSQVLATRAMERLLLRMAGRRWKPASASACASLNEAATRNRLTDVLERMVSGLSKAHQLEQLLPWDWKAEQLAAAVGA